MAHVRTQACYPGGGAKYTKHIDNTARDGRRLSVVCYLNSDWQPAHGGCLRLHPMTSSMLSKSVLPGAEVAEARVVEVEPVAGRLVAFFADEMLHEVSRTFQPRHALTLWFYDCDERRRAAARRGAGEETMAAATTTIGGPDPPVDAGDAGDDALGEVMQLLQMLAQEVRVLAMQWRTSNARFGCVGV
jgi:hypoxia-inducible factor (prolyl hydroxylase)